ncbi:RNA-directed DNA polymerase, eukaryota [Tanacetum coccineum]
MGDFNEVRNKNERFGTIFNVHGANAFNSFISMANLEEVPLGGCSFTWCHRSASKMSHRLILLCESTHDYGPIPFRFFHYWLEMEGFENFVNEVWREAPVDNSNAMINMMNKLKYLKKKIRVWNGMRQSPKTRKHVLKQELADLEMIIDKGDASSDTLHKRAEVVKSIQEVDKLCAMEASQKAKIKWAIEGDENSKYYHGILNKKRNQLSIRGVLVEGDWVENPNMVKNEFLNHFKNRFDRPKSVRPMLNMEFPHHLNSMQQLDLEAEVSNEEIKKAVWDCGVDKSPGPDGFTFGFYKRFWSLIEKDVLAAVKYFFHYSRIPKGCNSSFIALIPKTPEAKMVKDFRPISLIGSLYKIIAKILANRLVVVLGDIVNEVQSAFVADRQILDGPFILNEVLQWCKLKKKHSFILKIDFEKAYDSVRWDYLDDVLRKFGFGEKWCGWIQECLRSSWGSVLVNGSPTEEFQFFKGLKQGDPLSPFIFILVMESLHISFKRVVDAGMFKALLLKLILAEDGKKYSWNQGWLQVPCLANILYEVEPLKIKGFNAGSEEDCRCGIQTFHQENWDLGLIFFVLLEAGSGQDRLKDLTTYVKVLFHGVTLIGWFPEVSTQTRWIKAVPIKVNIHAWKVRMDCLPTRLNISRRDLPLVGEVDFMDCKRSMNGFLDRKSIWILSMHKRLLEGLSPLTQTEMVDFVSVRAVIEAAQWCGDLTEADPKVLCDVLNYAFLPSRLQSVGLHTKLLRHTGIVISGPIFDNALCVFNTSMESDLLSNPSEITALKLMKKLADIYFMRGGSDFKFGTDYARDHAVSRAGIIGIKNRQNLVRETFVDICYRSGISAGKEVDIGLDGGRDKP